MAVESKKPSSDICSYSINHAQTRAAFSGAGCQRTARGYGLGRWGYGLGRCQLGSNQLENFLEFLGVEMLKIRGVLCFVAGAASDIFEGGRCRCGSKISLRSQTLGFFASDPFLISSTIFYPKSHTHPNGTLGTPKMTSKEFECFFHKLLKKIPKLRFALTIIITIYDLYINI